MEEPVQDLTPRIADCLKVIYDMQEHGQKVSTSAVSERLGVSDATVTMLFKDFAAAGYNKSLIFQYFGDKLGLYTEVVKRSDREMTVIQTRILTPLLEDETNASNARMFKALLETIV